MKSVFINISICIVSCVALCLSSCTKSETLTPVSTAQTTSQIEASTTTTSTVWLTYPDHIIFVWFENKGYPQIVGSSSAPYINSLIKKGTLFTSDYALTHPSYPNYIAFFSGSTQGVTTDDCISGQPFKKTTLYDALKTAGVSFRWYSESEPYNYYTDCSYGYYRERHNPTTIFPTTYNTCNKVFSASYFADTSNFKYLPKVVCISPNLMDDMHDGTISAGDSWLKNKLGSLANWCLTHNSVFVVYWDEDNKYYGNRIPVVAVGQHVKAGYQLGTKYDHYNWTKTICSMFKAPTSWASVLSYRSTITGCWK